MIGSANVAASAQMPPSGGRMRSTGVTLVPPAKCARMDNSRAAACPRRAGGTHWIDAASFCLLLSHALDAHKGCTVLSSADALTSLFSCLKDAILQPPSKPQPAIIRGRRAKMSAARWLSLVTGRQNGAPGVSHKQFAFSESLDSKTHRSLRSSAALKFIAATPRGRRKAATSSTNKSNLRAP